MQRRLYMYHERKSFWVILGVIFILGCLNAAIIIFVNPSNTLIEISELILLTAFLLLSISWILGQLKWGLMITGAIVSTLVLRRLNLLGWPSVGIELVLFGLISLIY